MDHFENAPTTSNKTQQLRQPSVRTQEIIALVQRSVREDPNASIRQRAQKLNLRPSTVYKILHEDLGFRRTSVKDDLKNAKKEDDGALGEASKDTAEKGVTRKRCRTPLTDNEEEHQIAVTRRRIVPN